MHEKEIRNLKLYVELIAKKYSGLGVPIEDLRQEGYIGIFKAKEHYNENKNTKFSSYAVWWIRQSIINALNTQSRLVHLPFGKINLFRKIKDLKDTYVRNYNREPNDNEIKEELQLSKNEHVDIVNLNNQTVYIDQEIDDESNSTLENFLVFDNEFEKELDLKDLKDALEFSMQSLSEREKFIIEKFFGLNNSPKMGLEEIGLNLDLTRERCRQIKKEALKKLRKQISLFFDDAF